MARLRNYGCSVRGCWERKPFDFGAWRLDDFVGGWRWPELCDAIATEAARVATVQLSALKFRSGIMPVVIGAGAGAMLLHEAIGHGLEGDFAALGRSVYAKSIGRRIAPSNVSVIDDPTIPASVVPINSMTKVKMREQHR